MLHILRELSPLPGDDEEDDTLAVRHPVPHGGRFQNFQDFFCLDSDLRGADAHAAGLERVVGASVNDYPAGGRAYRFIAVAPDCRSVLREVCLDALLIIRIVPKSNGLRREGRRADKLALRAR